MDSATSKTGFYTYNQQGDVEALTDTAGATLASYGYTAYGADDTTLFDSTDPNIPANPNSYPFNSYRFGAGRLDQSTGNLDLGYGTYNPNINGFISRAGIAGDPSGANAPSRSLTWGDALSFAGDMFLNWGWIQQSVHTIFQTDASAGDKAWAAASLLGAVGLDALQVTPAGWLSDAAKAVRLAKGADEAITAASEAEKLVTAANEANKVASAASDVADESADLARACSGEGLSFSADTMVATPSGERAIGSLKVGDQVAAYDPATGTSSTQTVQHVWVNHDHDLLDVTLHEDGSATQAADAAPDKAQKVATKAHGSQAPPSQDETIHTTEQHPWLTTDRGWVKAGDLHVGEQVIELGGHTATITALAVKPGAADYYNLTVSQLHTYAVGASRAVVHNTEGCLDYPQDADVTAKALGEGVIKSYPGSGLKESNFNVSVAWVRSAQSTQRVVSVNEYAWFAEGGKNQALLREALGGLKDTEFVEPIATEWGHAHAEGYLMGYVDSNTLDLLGIGSSNSTCSACYRELSAGYGRDVIGTPRQRAVDPNW